MQWPFFAKTELPLQGAIIGHNILAESPDNGTDGGDGGGGPLQEEQGDDINYKMVLGVVPCKTRHSGDLSYKKMVSLVFCRTDMVPDLLYKMVMVVAPCRTASRTQGQSEL